MEQSTLLEKAALCPLRKRVRAHEYSRPRARRRPQGGVFGGAVYVYHFRNFRPKFWRPPSQAGLEPAFPPCARRILPRPRGRPQVSPGRPCVTLRQIRRLRWGGVHDARNPCGGPRRRTEVKERLVVARRRSTSPWASPNATDDSYRHQTFSKILIMRCTS